ncbi:Cytochrome P450 [Amanita muscaria]
MLFSNSILLDSLILFSIPLALAKLVIDRRSSRFALLRGPRSNNVLIGRLLVVEGVVDDVAAFFDRWISEYGYVFKVPTGLGTNCIVISDPKAVAHIYANDSFGYLRPALSKMFSRTFMGDSMITADKDDHRRQRRAVAPAFTNGALRESMSDFYNTAYKLKRAWDALFESHDEVTIDVQQWLNKLTLDSIGIAGFGHDFGSLDGLESPVTEAFDAVLDDTSFRILILIGSFLPQLLNIPFARAKILRRLRKAFSDIAKVLLEKSLKEKESSDAEKDRSILGLLLKGRSHNTNFKLLQDEVVGQVVRFLQQNDLSHIYHSPSYHALEGYETTAISLSWALVELARHPEKQDKLRRELLQISGDDPTWDQVVTGTACPYLDAVANEALRLHPPIEALQRIADKDDVVPLSFPMKTSSGETVDSFFVPKGTTVTTPFIYMNRSEAFWGPDAKQFVPERWLEENPYPSKDFSGYKHLYTFSDGPRICIGRMFALAEIKAVLLVLIRNFTFDLPSGPDTPIAIHKILLPRPKLADEAGCVLRMRVRQVTG